MSWIALALLAPLFWAGSNILDKYSLDKVSRGTYDFLFFGTIGAVLIALALAAIFGLDKIGILALIPFAGGFLIQYSYLFYSYALLREDASYVIPLYITYSVVVLALGYVFLGETVSVPQFIGFGIVFLGAVVLSFKELSFELFRFRFAALLMIPAVLLISFSVIFLNRSLQIFSFTDTLIYDSAGFIFAGLSLLLVASWRREITTGIRTASMWKFGIFLVNDLIDLGGHVLYKYALLLAPSAGLVAVLGGIQPFYVLVLGVLFTLFLPKIVKEKITRKEITQKLVGVVIIFIGIVIMNVYP